MWRQHSVVVCEHTGGSVWAIRADALERLGRKKEVTLTLGLALTLTPTLTPNQP